MIIDFHTHIFPTKFSENREKYVNDDLCFSGLYSSGKARMVTAEELIENMDRENIDVSVIVNIGWTSHELCVETNDYIMESVSRYQGRLYGYCSVQPNAKDEALKEIERCIKGGIKGVGEMRPDVQSMNLAGAGFYDELVDLMVKNDLSFMTHSSEPVGHRYQGKGVVTPDLLYSFITMYPALKLILSHWGGGLPFYYLMPEVKKAASNVYYDTAASPFLYSPEVYNHVLDLAGPDRILFGTDYPLLKPSRLLAEIDSLKLPEKTREMIVAENAKNLLGIT